MPRSGRNWTRGELIAVCALYHSLPFGRMHQGNPKVAELARLLGRTPGSVAMKLVNFASLDPAQTRRGIRGLRGASGLDRRVWEEFTSDLERWGVRSELVLERLRERSRLPAASRQEELEGFAWSGADTEAAGRKSVRLAQAFFRKMVLAANEDCCCVSGLPVEELLVASHILPWSRFPRHRVDPHNGLCLAAHLDRAFDRGLITIDEEMRLRVSPRLRSYPENSTLAAEFLARDRQPVRVSGRYPPKPEYLEFHRKQIFVAG